jgi:hypothetical protein
LELTGVPRDNAVEECFTVNEKWQEGKAKFQDARDVADRMLRLAREEKDHVREKVLRVYGTGSRHSPCEKTRLNRLGLRD